ncbi:MAG: hypothetical protein DMF46_05145 [Verrucomicrobia bacterium]|nr:MAG: hypothetical protein DMF46_05145 [Verrucomicrobiota bacterium]
MVLAITILIRHMNTHVNRSKDDEDGFTLVEVVVAAMLVAIFFVSIFEVNAMCLRYMDASKESLAALQSVQDRAEVLRNLAFSDLTTTSFVRNNVMPANYTPDKTPTLFSKKATEVVRITQYPAANGVTQFTRLPNGTHHGFCGDGSRDGVGASGRLGFLEHDPGRSAPN